MLGRFEFEFGQKMLINDIKLKQNIVLNFLGEGKCN